MNPTLSELHTAIFDYLTVALPGAHVLPPYPDLRRTIKALPAVLVELSGMEPGDDPGTGEVAFIGRFSGRVIVDPNLPEADMEAREIAIRLAVALSRQDFGLPIGIARLVDMGEDGFSPDLDGYLVWLVEWTHSFNQGEALP
ncbi:MAG: hypothetical protein LBF93_02395 [Zoogloeaceae bacterium]|jgi:hypothetical protein|nr:hypothetical protein [Zoogloeaceae bacterium]